MALYFNNLRGLKTRLHLHAIITVKEKEKEKEKKKRIYRRLYIGFVNLSMAQCVNSVQIRSYFWSVFSCIRIEYGDLRSKSPYSIRIRENMDQK